MEAITYTQALKELAITIEKVINNHTPNRECIDNMRFVTLILGKPTKVFFPQHTCYRAVHKKTGCILRAEKCYFVFGRCSVHHDPDELLEIGF